MVTTGSDFERLLVGLDEAPRVSAPERLSTASVVGTGSTGLTMAVAALAASTDVTVHSPIGSDVESLADARAITVTGSRLAGEYAFGSEATSRPAIRLERSLDRAVRDADVVFLTTEAVTHAMYAGLVAALLRPGQLLVLVPGGTFGAVEVARVLRRHRALEGVTVVELGCTPYLTRSRGPGRVEVLAERRRVPMAALPNSATPSAAAALQVLVPALEPVSGVLAASFANVAGPLVAVPALLSAASISDASWADRLPPDVVDSVVAALDAERCRTAFAFGIRDVPSLTETLLAEFGGDGRDLVETIEDVPGIADLPAPRLGARHVHDAIATGLVPVASAAHAADVSAPATSALVAIASVLDGFDHARAGRTIEALGLDRLRPDEVRRALDGTDPAALEVVLR